MNPNIQDIIRKTLKDFVKYQWKAKKFLTEDDLRCRLFCKLQSKLEEYSNISVHAEVRWYGDKGPEGQLPLKCRSDIVIIDRTDLRDNETLLFELPSKGYGFNKYYCIIEIKLRRPNDKSSDKKFEEIIKKDVDKLKEIREKTAEFNTNKSYYVMVFDKKRKIKRLIEVYKMKTEHNIKKVWSE